jgi:multidrug efflux pump subunit AcrB
MFARFFIDRPIFAWVISIVITLAGFVAMFALPVAQYPDITPPTVEVSAVYPGANARVVADTVAAPIEQQVNGVEGMMYMSSQCANDGSYTLTVTFQPGTDLNIAQVLVQNRESLAEPILPDLVKRRGIAVKKKSPNVLLIVNLFSKDASRDNLELSNEATIHIRDELSRLAGVGDISYLGQRDYSMRLWLDPQKLASYGLIPQDVIKAVEAQNIQVAAGQIGQPPVPSGQVSQYIITTLGRLQNTDQFANIIVKQSGPALVYLKDVANIELGAQSYDQTCTLDGKPSVALSVYQLPGSNALDVARRVKQRMKELRKRFPPGMDYAIVYDTTPFIRESIDEVFHTLRDAVILVAIVVLFFLQDWRAMILPMIDVPVSLIGTFAVMALMGFSLNNLTLFGLVLAIGIVVDDAIVVLENIERLIATGLDARTATIKAMDEITGPIIAITLVLCSVFIPSVFITGITGQFYRQFALTISVAMIISAINALTLTPSRAAAIFKTEEGEHGTHEHKREALPWWIFAVLGGLLTVWLGPKFLAGQMGLPPARGAHADSEVPAWLSWVATAVYFAPGMILGGVAGWFLIRPVNGALAVVFRGFNRSFDAVTAVYGSAVSRLLRVSLLVVLAYGGLLYLTYWSFTSTPTGFIPAQDKGYLLVNVQLPDAAAVGRTRDVVRRIEAIALKTRGVKHSVAISGQSILLGANASNFGALYLMLDDFEHRAGPGLSSEAIAAALQERFQKEEPKAVVNIFGAPPVEGLGTAGGFKIVVLDTGDNGMAALQHAADEAVAAGERDPHLQGLFSSFRADTPWLELLIDRAQAKDRGVSIDDVRTTLESTFGPYYINDFNRFGRTWQVNVQALQQFRQSPEDFKLVTVRNNRGEQLPLSTFASVRFVSGPVTVMRYNLYEAAAVHAEASPGTSSGQAIAALEAAADEQLPQTMRAEWTELGLLQLQTGNTALYVFFLAVVLVFLVLAAQYESWSLPLAVILVVPMCLLCAVTGVIVAKMDINIFTQIGLIVLVGLACKNAILIVEFAKSLRESGMPRQEATLLASRLRLRPIIMTSFAFILGVVPLMLSQGAGAEMRRTLGTAVFAGMLGVTLFGIFLTPVFFYVIQWFKDCRGGPATEGVGGVPTNPPHGGGEIAVAPDTSVKSWSHPPGK